MRKAGQKQAAATAAAARKAEQEAATSDVQRLLVSAQQQLRRLWHQQPVVSRQCKAPASSLDGAAPADGTVHTVSCIGLLLTPACLPTPTSHTPTPLYRLQYSVGVSDRTHAYQSTGPGPQPSAYGWLALAAAAGVAGLLVLGRNLQWPWGGGRRGEGGRWVRDRSLGGKMVFIPDAELPGSSNGKKPARPLYEDPEDEAPAAVSSTGGAAAAGPWANASPGVMPAGRKEEELPSWWKAPNFLVYTTFSRKDELQQRARMALRELEDAKLQVGWGGVGERGGVGS